MAADAYTPAALRHAADARTLHDAGAYDNAVYLGGYAVECTLKGWIEAKTSQSFPTHDLARLETVALAATIYRIDRYSAFPSDAVMAARGLRWSPSIRYRKSGCQRESESKQLIDAVERMIADTIRPLVLDGVLTP